MGGSDDFLINGVTIAFLNSSGTTPSDNEQLTILVIEDSRISIHSLTRNVCHGSNKQDLEGDLMIIFLISSRETCLKQLKLVTSDGRGRVNESLEENEFLILAILSLKKVTNWSARPKFLDS